ncbi:MAG: hypothetical protein ACLFTE_07680 [Salinivenus sp.]
MTRCVFRLSDVGRLGSILFILGFLASSGRAQGIDRVGTRPYEVVYRPDSVSYHVVQGDRFDLIYQAGSEEMARRTAAALSRSWPGTDSLVGPVAQDVQMPVIINNFTDRSNGIVDPIPFRQEIEAPSIKVDPVVAHASSWPDIVGPHEGVHAAHAEVAPGAGVGALLRAFAPDAARSLNLNAPSGLIEGAAVYRESRLEPGTGRLNAPLFSMKMKAAMLSDDPWSFTQMMETPSYTQPFNRHYIGGGHAFEYLAERGDSISTGFFSRAVGTHNRIPFVGHGVWLGRSTGQRPGQLRSEMQAALRDEYEDEMERRAPFTNPTMVAGATGRNHRRPYWLSDSTLVAHVSGYGTRPGFYRLHAASGKREPIRVQSITEDYSYSLSPDTSALLASRYVQSPLVPKQQTAEIEQIDLASGKTRRLTEQGRAFAPVRSRTGALYTATNNGPFSELSVVESDGSIRRLTPPAPLRIRQVAPSPTDDRVAILVHEAGDQRLYRTREPIERAPTLHAWIDLPDGVIYDVTWGPEGRYLLFAAERGTTANIYAHDTQTGETLQVTNVRFGALEPVLSPDRSTLAFVRYRHEQYDLVRMPFRPEGATPLADSLVRQDGPPLAFDDETTPSERGRDTTNGADRAPLYSAWDYLAPRMVYPTLQTNDGGTWDGENPAGSPLGVGVGVGLAGSDPLQQWAYKARGWWQDGRLWGEAKVQTARSLLRPSLSAYNRAFATEAQVGSQSSVRTSVEERGVNLGLRLPVSLQSNVYQTALRFQLDTELRQTRLSGGGLSTPTPYTSRLTLSPAVGVAYRLQRNPRDVVPNTGFVMQAQGQVDAWTDQGPGSVAGILGADVYLPFLRETHTGIRLGTRLLFQKEGSVYNVRSFVPRGVSTAALPAGTFLQFEGELTQPLWYIDDGLSLVPVYAKALSVYGFVESLGRVRSGAWDERVTSLGGGLRLEARFFYNLELDLRLGVAYQPADHRVDLVGR